MTDNDRPHLGEWTMTPINTDRLQMELTEHPDRDFVLKLVNDLRDVFPIGI